MSSTVFFESSSELATVRNVFKVAGVATDPTTVSLTITDPTQTATTYTYAAAQITKNTTGDYQKDIVCSIDGTWTYEWVGTGTASDAVAGTWEVHETGLGQLYATVETVKNRMRIINTEHDREVHDACFAASRGVEMFCERIFHRSAPSTVRTFVPHDYYCLNLPEFCDLVSVASLKTDAAGDGAFETTWASTDYQLWPVNPAAAPEQKPYTKIKAIGSQLFPYPSYGTTRSDRIEITGVWGWPAVPWAVKLATAELAQDLFQAKDSRGGAFTGEFGVFRIRQNQLMVDQLNPYARNPWSAKGRIMVA